MTVDEQLERSKRRPRLGRVGLGILPIAAAVITELRKPPRKRKWHGKLFGVVPYDLRLPPTEKRLKAAFWRPRGPLFSPQALGVGWTLNFGRLARILKRA